MTAPPVAVAEPSLTQRTYRAAGWQTASVISSALLQLGVAAILARHLSAVDFGLVGIAYLVINFVGLFSEIGLGPALVQRADLTPRHIRVAFTTCLLLSVAVAAALWLAATPVARYFTTPAVVPVLRALAWSPVLAAGGVVAQALLEREMRFRALMVAEVGSYVIGFAGVGVPMALRGAGVGALVAAALTQSGVKAALLLAFRPHDPRPSLRRDELHDLARFGGGLTLSRIFNYGAQQGDNIVVGKLLGTAALGIYSRAFQIMQLPGNYLGNVLDRVLFPGMSRVQEDRPRLGRIYLRAMTIVVLIIAPLSVGMIVLAPEIVALLLGPAWGAAVLPLRLLLVSTAGQVGVRISDSLVRAVGAVYASAVRKAAYAFLLVLAAAMGARSGLPGVATGVSVAVVLGFAMMAQLALHLTQVGWRALARTLAPGLLVAAVTAGSALLVRAAAHGAGLGPAASLVLVSGGALAAAVTFVLAWPRVLSQPGIIFAVDLLAALPRRAPLTTISTRLGNAIDR